MNWDQLKTILWLRWRLMCNQGRRGGGLGAVLTVLFVILGFSLAALCFAGGLFGAVFGLGKASPTTLMMVWLGVTVFFLFLWMIGLLTELQRSETIDLQKLMHLPVALGQMFTVNYLVSHFTLSVTLVVPAMLGLGIGLAMARGPEMILLVPLALSMVFMVTAWTYCLRGWLATMMSNPRRRRTVIMGISLAFVLIAQGPNLYFNVFQNRNLVRAVRHRPGTATPEPGAGRFHGKNVCQLDRRAKIHSPAVGVPRRAGAGRWNPLPALFGTLGCAGIAGLGLRRAYRGTFGFITATPAAKRR